MNDDQSASEPMTAQELSRREFLDKSVKAISLFFGLTLGVPAAAYVISPALQPTQESWVKLARTSQVETGIPTLFTVTVDKTIGWAKSQVTSSYFVYTIDGKNFKVMSNICPHVGCRTNWNGELGQIVCPCHDARFDTEGNVISGPPARGLDQVVFRLDEAGNILVDGG
jgi:menaquinol-cytochrome c reductase iron-sulfur subunit